jgi:hypothetical protein
MRDLRFFVWMALLIALFVIVLAYGLEKRERECGARGGEFHYLGRGSSLCLRPDAVIKP